MVTREQFFAAARKASVRPVSVGGLDLFVRGVSGDERTALIERARAGNPMQAKDLVALCVCNEAGEPVFTADDLVELGKADGAVLEELGQQILAASKLLPDSQDASAKN